MSRAVARLVLLAVVLAEADPAAAQNGVASTSVETLCRVAPEPSAEAVWMLEEGDLILRYEGVSTSTGQWIRVTSSLFVRDGGPDHCWVPSSDLVLSRGTGHFLQLADGLLSADLSPTLDELLAVHNLFEHPWYREQVEAFAVLTERRRDLLARAVEVAQRPRLDGRRPVDDDLLVLAWLESLGEEPMGSAEDRRGEGPELVIIAPDVACRSHPSRTAYYYSHILPLDFHFRAERADTTVAGEDWVHVGLRACWVLGAHTAPGDSEEHVVSIADRFLTSGEGWSSDNRLRLYIILSGWNRGHRGEVEGSPALGLARLRVLRIALHEFRPHAAGVRTHAWIASLGDEVALTDEGHSWTVSDEAYLSLYEQHQADPSAEEILWTYAMESDGYSCEGEFACSVRAVVIERLARYWTDFPRGRHIAEAVEEALALVGSGLELCNAARGPEKDTPEAGMWSWSGWDRSGVELTRELLATLAEVKEEDKAPLLESLAELEACAA